MRTPGTEVRVRRIVVALDALCENRGALAAGARLALHWRCELQGVFVVDADLLRLGDLPGVRQVGLSTSDCGLLDAAGLASNLAGLEARARRACAETARTVGITASFMVARGDTDGASVDLADDDLLVVEETMRPLVGRVRLETRWRRYASTTHQPVLLLRRGAEAAGPVLCLHDGGPASGRVLALAARLAADRGDPLAILVAAGADPAVAATLGRDHPRARIQHLAGDSDAAWRRGIDAVRPSLIVVAADAPADRWSASSADLLLVP